MKKYLICTLLLVFASISFLNAQEREIFELRTYYIESDAQEHMLDRYLKDAYIPALHRVGVKKVGVFKPIEGKNEDFRATIVFIPYSSGQVFQKASFQLNNDAVFKEAGEAFIEAAHDNPPYVRLENTLMWAFSATPQFSAPEFDNKPKDRVYELRSYESATEKLHKLKVDMFNSGESKLFIDLGFQPLFFGEVVSGSHMPNLIYMTCHENEEAQKVNWKSFVDSDQWNEMKVIPKYANTVSHIDKWMLYPTDYSEL